MAIHTPLPTTHPSVPSGAWTKINTVSGSNRRRLLVVNENSSVNYRIETCGAHEVAALGASSGLILTPGGSYTENYDSLSSANVYAYQGSGGALTTLAVKEGV